MAKIETNLGAVMIVHSGAHDSTLAYSRLRVVEYNGSSYISIQDVPENILISDTNYWRVICKGALQTWIEQGHEGTYSDFIAWLQEPANSAAEMALDTIENLVLAITEAETNRSTAEQTRQTNETARVASETARNVASNVYNVTLSVPLAAGQYYTSTTARSAVPAGVRKKGLILNYETSAGVWYSERFVGSDVAAWTTATNWAQLPDKAYVDNLVAFKPTTAQGNILFAGPTNNILGDSNLFWDNANKFFGMGLSNPSANHTIKSIIAQENATIGSEILTALGWISVDWTGDFASGFTHTTGNINSLSVLPNVANNTKYLLEIVISNRTAGSFTVNFGGVKGVVTYNSNGTRWQGDTVIDNTKPIEVVPTTDFNGTVKLSLKQITGTTIPIFRTVTSTGAAHTEIRNTESTTNTLFGLNAGRYLIKGNTCVAFGYNALQSATTAQTCTAIGAQALQNNTSGNNNTAVGFAAMLNNLNGYLNTGLGIYTLYSNTFGFRNIAVGYASMYANITGSDNAALGINALYANVYGGFNTSVGNESLSLAKSSLSNTAIGHSALLYLGGSISATSLAIGRTYTIDSIGTTDFTLIGAASNTIGLSFVATGVGIGTGTVTHDSTGNIGIGRFAGRNILNPYGGSLNLTIAQYCTLIGTSTKTKNNNAYKEIVLGADAVGNGDYTATIGDSSNTGTFFKSVYAELYAADNATTQSIPTGATYTKINQFTTAGQTNTSWVTASAVNDNLVVFKPGRYKIEATASTKSGAANILLKTAIFVGGVKAVNIQAERKISAANEPTDVSLAGIINIAAANTEVDLRVSHDNPGSVNLTCVHSNLHLVYISE